MTASEYQKDSLVTNLRDYQPVLDRLNDVEFLRILHDAIGFTFEATFEQNIAKLKARYPNKFTEQDALIRNLEKERAILEEPRTAKGSLD